MNKRQTKILELLTQNKKVEVTKLSELLGVSQVTIRKDLDALSESGMLIREHGYATLNKSDDMNIRLAYHYEQKQKVAKKAVESIQHGETIMIESGSCCALVALEIAKTKKDVTLITNSAFIADYIRKHTAIKIILLGGEYQHESQVMVGPMRAISLRDGSFCAWRENVQKHFLWINSLLEQMVLVLIQDLQEMIICVVKLLKIWQDKQVMLLLLLNQISFIKKEFLI